MSVMLQRLAYRTLHLGSNRALRPWSLGERLCKAIHHERMGLPVEGEAIALATGADDPTRRAGEGDQLISLSTTRAPGEFRGEAGSESEFEPERKREATVGCTLRIQIDQSEIAAEQVVGGIVGIASVEEPQHRIARAGGCSEGETVSTQFRIALERLGSSDGCKIASAPVQHQPKTEERLQSPPESRFRFTRTLGDRVQSSVLG